MRAVAYLLPDVLKASSSSGVQLLITLICTPIITRLFDPADYGEFGFINNAAAMIVGLGFLSLPSAYAQAPSLGRRLAIMRACIVLLGGGVLFSVCLAMLPLREWFPALGDIRSSSIWFLPLLVLVMGLRQLTLTAAVQRKAFDAIALNRISDAIVSRSSTIGAGYLMGSHAAYMITAMMLGQLTAAWIMLRGILRAVSFQRLIHWLSPRRANVRAALKDHSDFAVYLTIVGQFPNLLMIVMQALLVAAASKAAMGQFVLAFSILTLPLNFVAMAAAPIVFTHLRDLNRRDPSAIFRHVALFMALFVGAGALILWPVYLFGPQLFVWALGDQWAVAGQIASLFVPYFTFRFAYVGLDTLFNVRRKLALRFWLEVLTMPLLIAVCAYATMHFPLIEALSMMASGLLLYTLIFLTACLFVARPSKVNTQEETI